MMKRWFMVRIVTPGRNLVQIPKAVKAVAVHAVAAPDPILQRI
jgi:hypothetical protein